MSNLYLITNVIPDLKTKMYLVKAAVYRLFGCVLKTRDLKKLAIAKGWVGEGRYGDFRRKQTWLDVYDALVRAGRMATSIAAA